MIAQRIEAESLLPTLLIGDFNEPLTASRWPRLARTGLSDCFGRAKERRGSATFRVKGISLVRIDWILATADWRVRELRTLDRASSGGAYPSDHHGVFGIPDLPGRKPGRKPKRSGK